MEQRAAARGRLGPWIQARAGGRPLCRGAAHGLGQAGAAVQPRHQGGDAPPRGALEPSPLAGEGGTRASARGTVTGRGALLLLPLTRLATLGTLSRRGERDYSAFFATPTNAGL